MSTHEATTLDLPKIVAQLKAKYGITGIDEPVYPLNIPDGIYEVELDGQAATVTVEGDLIKYTIHERSMATMTEKELRETIERITDETTGQYIRDLPTTVRDILYKATLSLLGLDVSNHWGGSIQHATIKVDHCNGRRSTIIDIVEKHTRAEVERIVPTILPQAFIETANDKEFRQGLFEEARRVYKQVFHDAVHKLAIEQAKADADALLKHHREKLAKFKELPLNTDLQHPNGYSGHIGEAVLEHMVNNGLGVQLQDGSDQNDGTT